MIALTLKQKEKYMKINTSNLQFQSARISCLKAKTGLLLATLMVCLIGSAGAAAPPRGVIRLTGNVSATENYRYYLLSDSRAKQPSNPDGLLLLTGNGQADTLALGQLRVFYSGMIDYLSAAGPQCARFVAPSGDSFYTATTSQMSDTADPRVKSIIEVHTVVGGTGYFTGAVGTFTVNRLVTIAPEGLTGSSEGSLNGIIHVIFQPPPL